MTGAVLPITEFTEQDLSEMLTLMQTYYAHVEEPVFRRDFADKDYCLVLRDAGRIVGFTTQKLLTVEADGAPVYGVFSGDTIIHRDYWGQTGLYQIFAQFWFPYAAQYEEFYWFLICKGYKTYGILPLIWEEFYPNYRCETPERERRIIDAYASALYPEEYHPETGVIEYTHLKDRLRPGVAEIDARRMKNRDVAYFCERNPHHAEGNDLACLARLDVNALRPRMAGRLGLL